MKDQLEKREIHEMKIHEIAATVTSGAPSIVVNATVTRVDEIKVEYSSTTRFLRMRNGDLQCNSEVSILVDGEWHELTVDKLPSD